MSPVSIQGHRGYGSLAPDNSLAAFKRAGADPNVSSVEFDVRCSSDGHLVVTHGPECGPVIENATLGELQSQDIGGGEGVPLLADVVETCLKGKVAMNVEIKPGGSALETTLRTIELLRSKKAAPYCSISSFDRNILKTVVEAAPDLPVGCLYNANVKPMDPDDFSKGFVYEDVPEDFATWLDRELEGDSVNLRSEVIIRDSNLVRAAKKAGKKVLAWMPTINNPGYEEGEECYRRLVDLGVDTICCNHPDILADILHGGKQAPCGAVEKDSPTQQVATTRSAATDAGGSKGPIVPTKLKKPVGRVGSSSAANLRPALKRPAANLRKPAAKAVSAAAFKTAAAKRPRAS